MLGRHILDSRAARVQAKKMKKSSVCAMHIYLSLGVKSPAGDRRSGRRQTERKGTVNDTAPVVMAVTVESLP